MFIKYKLCTRSTWNIIDLLNLQIKKVKNNVFYKKQTLIVKVIFVLYLIIKLYDCLRKIKIYNQFLSYRQIEVINIKECSTWNILKIILLLQSFLG